MFPANVQEEPTSKPGGPGSEQAASPTHDLLRAGLQPWAQGLDRGRPLGVRALSRPPPHHGCEYSKQRGPLVHGFLQSTVSAQNLVHDLEL